MASNRPSIAVAACLDLLGGETCAWDRVIARRANSRVHRAYCDGRPIAVKECFRWATRVPDPSAAEREYSALARLAEAMPTTDRGSRSLAPLPLQLCREHATYGMSWVPGTPATDVILSVSADVQRASAVGEAAGTWLRRLHSMRASQERRNDFEARLDVVRQHAAEVRYRGPLIAAAAEALARHAPEAAAVPMPASWMHGDMKTDNLLIDGDAAAGLDLQLVHENTVAYDLAPFLNHLRLLRWTVRGMHSGRKLNAAASAFLRAYSPDTKRWGMPIAWLQTYQLIQRASPIEPEGSLRAMTARWPIRRELAHAIRALDAASG